MTKWKDGKSDDDNQISSKEFAVTDNMVGVQIGMGFHPPSSLNFWSIQEETQLHTGAKSSVNGKGIHVCFQQWM
jgi:hypothetical protein